MNAQLDIDWSADNHQLLVAEFTRLRALLGDGDVDASQARVNAVLERIPAPSAIDTLAQLFELGDFERDLLLLVAGVELDSALAALCAEAQGHPQRAWASFGLALAVLPNPHWSAIAPLESLRRHRLLDLDDGEGLASSRVKMDERVLHFICGLNYLDHRLGARIMRLPTPGLMADSHQQLTRQVAKHLGLQWQPPRQESWTLLSLVGNDSNAQQDVAGALALSLGIGLYRIHAADIPTPAQEQEALARLWQREAALLGCGLLIQHDEDHVELLARFVERLQGLVILAGPLAPRLDRPCRQYVVDKPDGPEQRRMWLEALGQQAQPALAAVDAIAGHFSLDAQRIAQNAELLRHTEPEQMASELHRLCRVERGNMGELAQRIEARAGWDELILPQHQRATLQQLSVHLRHRLRVLHDWGFATRGARGLGTATLFCGESGTGKTLAAEVLANELGLALYRIDLSAVVSKYIGETEKNLRKLFDSAEDVGAILLFDEADALFGKRSEVKDSHDRYANIEVSYLLQRMEAYRGLAILTTNHKTALDQAFQRRLRFVMNFPFPDALQREAIWRCIFPKETPLGTLDYPRLARLNVAGGSIRNIAMTAAFFAAEADTALDMTHLLRATQLEAAKTGKAPSDAEIRGWV